MATRNGKESIMFPCQQEFLFFNFPVTKKKKKDWVTKFQREKNKTDSKLWASWVCDLCNLHECDLNSPAAAAAADKLLQSCP